MYQPIVRPGIEPMCGWEWIHKHRHDLDGWTPTIEIIRPGSRFTMTVKDNKALNEAVKIISGKER